MAASVLTWSSSLVSSAPTSGYATTSSASSGCSAAMTSSDDEAAAAHSGEEGEWRAAAEGFPGICPHCNRIYDQPVTLQCGHSLCRICSDWLLAEMERADSAAASMAFAPCSRLPYPAAKTRPRMGISSYSRSNLQKAESFSSLRATPLPRPPWQSPQCLVCGERPKATPPVPNRDLEAFLTTLRMRQQRLLPSVAEAETQGQRQSLSSPLMDRVQLWDCNVAVVGARGVGKSTLKQTQFSNDMLVDDLLAGGSLGCASSPSPLPLSFSPLTTSSSRLQRRHTQTMPAAKYMLNILDASCSLDEKMCSALGFVVVYSITDRQSFVDAASLFRILTSEKGPQVPLVLLGAKADQLRRREVQAYEGQQLAKLFACPFFECSSRRNDCVNEAFIELARLIDGRGLLKRH